MCSKIMVLIGLLMFSLGANADDVYYRWSQSGSTSVSADCKTICLNSGASVRLTVMGAGRLTFSSKGWGCFYCKKDSQTEIDLTTVNGSQRNISIDLTGEKTHTIEWCTTKSPHLYYREWGEITSIKWQGLPIQYAALIEWDANSGKTESAISHVKHGDKVITLPEATRQSFTFDGWYTKKDGGEKINTDYVVSSDCVFYAHWTPLPKVAISPSDGTMFSEMQSVTIECPDENVAIYYTLDGSEPTAESIPYKRFRIIGKTTVKAVAVKDGILGEVVIARYALGNCVPPTISLADGSSFVHSNQIVAISWNETDGTLRYTLDGSEPTEDSAEYTGAFQINETTTVKAKVFSDRYFDSDVVSATLTRKWVQVTTPVISTAAAFTGDKSRVTISCATDGAKIRYTLDGSTPNTNSELYEGAFYITNSCTIKAYATVDDCTDSATTSVSVTKVWGAGDAIGVPSAMFSYGGNANWVRDAEVDINGCESMRSGPIGNKQTSVLIATVKGKGTFSFWWKASCEDSGGYYDWDHAEFQVEGQKYHIDGETGWTQITHEFTTSGEHELRWTYYKDDAGKEGRDCVWVSAAQWDRDPIPEVGVNPTVEDIEDALYGARDSRLLRRIAAASQYASYHSWADKACGTDFIKRKELKDSPNAWLAYMLDAPALVSKSALASEDIAIESIATSSVVAGAYDMIVDIAGTEIGEDATSGRLAEALGVEGASELDKSKFSSENLSAKLERTVDGKARVTVAPVGNPTSFFMRLKVK